VARVILERMGHEVILAESGPEALDLLASRTFDAVFMDVQMPEMDGLQATAIIRERESISGGRRLPIIAMTAYALAGDRDRCLGAGMDGYVIKPVKQEKISEALEQYVGIPIRRIEPSIQTATVMPVTMTAGIEPPHSPENPPGIPVFDRAGLVNRLGGEELVDTFLGKFRTSMPGYVDKLRSELDSGSTDAIRSVAHAIKGLAANIGAEQVRQTAFDIETAAKAGDVVGLGILHDSMIEAFDTFVRETAPDASAGTARPGDKTR